MALLAKPGLWDTTVGASLLAMAVFVRNIEADGYSAIASKLLPTGLSISSIPVFRHPLHKQLGFLREH